MTDEEKAALIPIFESTKDLYLCGFKLARYLDFDTQTLRRIQTYVGQGLCYEFAALAMMALRDYLTANLKQGYIGVNGMLMNHAWVEFEADSLPFVADFGWGTPVVFPARIYKKRLSNRKVMWVCYYEDFWSLQFSGELYEYMKNPETSYVFDSLEAYRPRHYPWKDNFGFRNEIKNRVCEPEFCLYDVNGRILSGDIIGDFIKNINRNQPKRKTLLLANKCAKVLNSL